MARHFEIALPLPCLFLHALTAEVNCFSLDWLRGPVTDTFRPVTHYAKRSEAESTRVGVFCTHCCRFQFHTVVSKLRPVTHKGTLTQSLCWFILRLATATRPPGACCAYVRTCVVLMSGRGGFATLPPCLSGVAWRGLSPALADLAG